MYLIASGGSSLILLVPVAGIAALFLLMMFARRQSKVPESDTAVGNPELQEVRKRLKSGDWQTAHDYLTRISDKDERAAVIDALSSWKERPKWLDNWVESKPDSSLPYLVRGAHSIHWAWEARGSGFGDQVSTKRFQTMFDRLNLAQEDLEKAIELDPRDPTPFAFLIRVAMGLEWDREETQELLEQARELCPEHRLAHRNMLIYLCEKWHGSHEEMFEFARNSANNAKPGSGLHTLVGDAHWHRQQYQALWEERGDYDKYFLNQEVRSELLAAYHGSLASPSYRENAFTLQDRNVFAYCLVQANELGLARREFELIGNHMTEWPWLFMGGSIGFRDARHKALRAPVG